MPSARNHNLKTVRISKISILISLFFIVSSHLSKSEENLTLRVMTFNIWVGGSAGKQPIEQTTEVIRKSKADIVGMQETRAGGKDSSQLIADSLGWHLFAQGGNTSILSRYPIEENSPNKWGVVINLPNETKIHFFNIHFRPSPYQPYQLKGIPYGNAPFIKTEEEAIEWAKKARGDQVERMFLDITPVLESGHPIFITGDFNEPSFQDWSERAANKKIVPIAVKYPATFNVVNAGFTDTFRKVHPDEIKNRGYTWTNKTTPEDPTDFHDRIDFVFSKGVEVIDSRIVGENKENADIVVSPWPSDHRAVVSTVKVPKQSKPTESKVLPSRTKQSSDLSTQGEK